MLEAFLDTYRRSYEEKQRKVDYLETVCSRLPKDHPLYCKMLLCKADALQSHVGFKAAISIFKQIWDGGSKGLEPAVVCGKLAHAQLLSGDAAGCRETALAGWEMYKDIPGTKSSIWPGANTTNGWKNAGKTAGNMRRRRTWIKSIRPIWSPMTLSART